MTGLVEVSYDFTGPGTSVNPPTANDAGGISLAYVIVGIGVVVLVIIATVFLVFRKKP